MILIIGSISFSKDKYEVTNCDTKVTVVLHLSNPPLQSGIDVTFSSCLEGK